VLGVEKGQRKKNNSERWGEDTGESPETNLLTFSMEIDPTKLSDASDATVNTLELWLIAQKLFRSIVRHAVKRVPGQIITIMSHA